MANVFAIHSVGHSVAAHLRDTYPADLQLSHPCEFAVVGGGEMNDPPPDPPAGARLTLYLYRVTHNQHLRNARRVTGPDRLVNTPLALDLHYLLTVWSAGAEAEQVVLAWAMRQLHTHSVLDASSLTPEAKWDDGEVLQIVPSELSNEDVMRIWDALQPPYRLTVSYTVRVVRVDADAVPDGPPVVATRFEYRERGAAADADTAQPPGVHP